MHFEVVLTLFAALSAAGFAFAVLLRKRFSAAGSAFVAGMFFLALQTAYEALILASNTPDEARRWFRMAQIASLPGPGFWLVFSLCYSRGNFREFLWNARYWLGAAFVVPITIASVWYPDLAPAARLLDHGDGWWMSVGRGAWFLNLVQLCCYVLILSNLEKTLRAASGTTQWRIKFVVLGLGVIFGAGIYTSSQTLLSLGRGEGFIVVDAGATLIGCILLAIAYGRRGFAELEVYPSRAFLQNSVTLLLAGGYLIVVGVFAQGLERIEGAKRLHTPAFVVLFSAALLGVFVLSDRLREQIRHLVTRHFRRPVHDYRQVWTTLTQNMSTVFDSRELCEVATRLISETFQALSVSIWLTEGVNRSLILGSSTSMTSESRGPINGRGLVLPDLGKFYLKVHPFDLERAIDPWIDDLKGLGASTFKNGGNRVCVPLVVNSQWLGLIILADKVNGRQYEPDEFDLLQCIGEHVTSGLLKLRLTRELMQNKELEAFQTMSAFFVHDLKNAASGLGLTLQNFRAHYDDPEFREDALRVIGKSAERINQLIARLSALRNRLELRPHDVDLNEIVKEALKTLPEGPALNLTQDLSAIPKIRVDREQFQSVINNLLLNAYDAVQGAGHIRVKTCAEGGYAQLSVTDDGCGMAAEFVRDSLFRPFQSTKKNGLGIGMFQSEQIIQAHSGNIEVETAPGEGTRFVVTVPLSNSFS